MTMSDQDPKENRLWAAMSAEDKAALRPHLTLRHLPKGDVVTRAGDEVKVVYLPVSADLVNIIRFEDERSGMATNVGREGVSGLAAFLADEPCGWDVEVQIAGDAWALQADALRQRTLGSPALHQLLMRLTHNNQVEAAQNAVCNAVHPVTPRLARWLLTIQDRTGRDEFNLTQEDLAQIMSVRRTTVNASWQELGRLGALVARRGMVRILSRDTLRDAACDCYVALKQRSTDLAPQLARADVA